VYVRPKDEKAPEFITNQPIQGMHPSLKKPLAGLATVIVAATATIYHTHWKQTTDREIMHQGVVRDIEREKYRLQQLRERNN
jgi:hypothetical protein